MGQFPEGVDQELARGDAAFTAGNEGMARVCARRAIGLLIDGLWTPASHAAPWPRDTLHKLRRIHEDEAFPIEVRQAAQRLTTKVTQQDTMPFPTDPLADARLVIRHLMNDTA
ncbi:MAG TPA: hypothetical protein EYN18_03745 [Nitrospirales bacterium]|nr:hypothetical protein [Nitrospirales bacterium]HIA14064.1 hypothetical protein [Nitrospirales bacterium]HIB55040.1 hypothetical protein [Nitrospirales bacterium]HIC04786.1 hypothetical protein [Nitrospirales bacterium]HIN33197.1 hypothetical protein [Nitrospirales bacterium]